MTYNDLCEEVRELGFETTLDSAERMFSSAKRALREIFTEHPLISNAVIFQRCQSALSHTSEIAYSGEEEITVPYNSARSFSFKSVGEGNVRIKEAGDERILSFSGLNSVTRDFLHGEGELTFFGDYAFTVRDLAFYGEITSARPNDIPVYGMMREYDMTGLVEGFISLAAPPADAHGRVIGGASVCGKMLTVPSSYSGDIYLICKRGSELSENGEIDIPAECEPMLALLTASYYWLDDDPEKAQYYRSAYRDGMSILRYNRRIRTDPPGNVGNGWA